MFKSAMQEEKRLIYPQRRGGFVGEVIERPSRPLKRETAVLSQFAASRLALLHLNADLDPRALSLLLKPPKVNPRPSFSAHNNAPESRLCHQVRPRSRE